MQMDTKSKSDHLSRKHKRVPKSPRAATSAHDTVPASHTARATTKLNRVGKKNKRKAADDHEGDSRRDFRGPKRSRVSPSSRLSQKRKLSQDGLQPLAAKKASTNSQARDIINKAPTERLNLYVFGSGESGELGLGTRNSTDVSRPRLNPNLLAASVGVVQVATGGMHCAALTYDNKILTWGVNDQGALGRDTAWEGGLVDIDDNKNDIDQAPQTSDNDTDLNPREAAPYPVDSSNFPEGTVFTQLAAGDSSTFALTNTGLVYGWGTFRGQEGIIGFTPEAEVQWRPVPLHLPQKITKLAAGCNHALALGVNGAVFSWGADESYKLGRRFISRRLVRRLEPREFGLPRQIVDIAAGSEHSFAIHRNGQVYSWGANGHAKTGIIQGVGNLDAMVTHPTVVESLKSHGPLKHMDGGNNHSIAVTADGKCLVWGRIDSFVTGLDVESIAPADVIYDSRGKKKTLRVPTVLPGLQVAFAAAGGEHCLAITSDGKAYSWGFSMGGQTGLGTDDDVEHATLINSKSVRDQHLVWAGAGGTYSILASKETTPRA